MTIEKIERLPNWDLNRDRKNVLGISFNQKIEGQEIEFTEKQRRLVELILESVEKSFGSLNLKKPYLQNIVGLRQVAVDSIIPKGMAFSSAEDGIVVLSEKLLKLCENNLLYFGFILYHELVHASGKASTISDRLVRSGFNIIRDKLNPGTAKLTAIEEAYVSKKTEVFLKELEEIIATNFPEDVPLGKILHLAYTPEVKTLDFVITEISNKYGIDPAEILNDIGNLHRGGKSTLDLSSKLKTIFGIDGLNFLISVSAYSYKDEDSLIKELKFFKDRVDRGVKFPIFDKPTFLKYAIQDLDAPEDIKAREKYEICRHYLADSGIVDRTSPFASDLIYEKMIEGVFRFKEFEINPENIADVKDNLKNYFFNWLKTGNFLEYLAHNYNPSKEA